MNRPNVADSAGSAPQTKDASESGLSLSPRFLRGLTLGALVGAAIAGSAIWDRLRNRDATPDRSATIAADGDPRHEA